VQEDGHATDYTILDSGLRESAGEALHDIEELVKVCIVSAEGKHRFP